MKNNLPPVFIVSSGRSGTTLLTAMLNASGQIFIPHESYFLARAYPLYGKTCSFSEDDYQALAELFKISSQKNGWGMATDYIKECLRNRQPNNFRDVNCIIYESYLQFKGIAGPRWGIKAPVLIASLPQIRTVFPDAKIVHLVRDGRDVLVSYRNVRRYEKIRFGPSGGFTTALYWVDGVRRIHQLIDTNIFQIRYEDLISEPKKELQHLCTFLGIQFATSMYESYYNSPYNKDIVLPEHKQGIHSYVQGPIFSDNKEKYKTSLASLDVLIFEFFSYEYLIKYAYPVMFKFVSFFPFNVVRHLAYFIARVINNFRYWRRYRKSINI